jgi:hypothetical protein
MAVCCESSVANQNVGKRTKLKMEMAALLCSSRFRCRCKVPDKLHNRTFDVLVLDER